MGYKPCIISTIVDGSKITMSRIGYKPCIISTIVDCATMIPIMVSGYKPCIISTIVDRGILYDAHEGL
mgnify:CR=1 FL=1